METGLSKNQLVSQLIKISHGELSAYTDIGFQALSQDEDLFAHMISWNVRKGEIRDSKVALPIIALRGRKDYALYENAVASLCKLSPRDLVKAFYYHKSLPLTKEGGSWWLKEAVKIYLRQREHNKNWWNKTAVQHRESLKALYALFHVKPSPYANDVLFQGVYPQGSVFERITQLKNMTPEEAAGTILTYNIPFLIAKGALGGIKGKKDLIIALIEKMSGAELITNTKMLEGLGVFTDPVLTLAYRNATRRTKDDTRVSTMKASKAAESVKGTEAAKHLNNIQEQKLQKLGGIEGDWLVLGDRSSSMRQSIEASRQIAALIAQQVKGKVYLVFFNQMPTLYDVSGRTLAEITSMTSRVFDSGMTSIGCGLELITSKGLPIDGIAICSDGGDNTFPLFQEAFKRYVARLGNEPTVYYFRVPGDTDILSRACQYYDINLEVFDLGPSPDYYALPNLIKTMRVGRYSLLEEIMECELLTLNDVFKLNEEVGT